MIHKILLTIKLCFVSFFIYGNFSSQEIFIPPNSPLIPDIIRLNQSGVDYSTITSGDGEQYFVKILYIEGDSNFGYYFGFSHRQYTVTLEPGSGGETTMAEVEPVDFDENATADGEAIDNIGGNSDSGYIPGKGMGNSFGKALGKTGIAALGSIYNKKLNKLYKEIADLEAKIDEKKKKIAAMRFSLSKEATKVALTFKENAGALKPFKNIDQENIRLFNNTGRVDLKNYQWKSEDTNFINKADDIRNTLVNAQVYSQHDKDFYEIGKQSLTLADQWSSVGEKQTANSYLKFAKTAADALTGWDPFTGTARNLYELATGHNPFTGEKLTGAERAFAAVGLVTFGYAAKVPVIYKLAKPLVQYVGKGAVASFRKVGTIIERTGNGSQKTKRIINFLSDQDPKWGLNMRHMMKHVSLVDGNFSLSKIDPKGNISIWTDYIIDLAQKSPTRTWTEKGQQFVEIRGVFNKTGSEGTFNLGVRLAQKLDGSWDLVTILTKNP